VQRLNIGDWCARRLGGSSAGLPDIVAVNNKKSVTCSAITNVDTRYLHSSL
jgi:Holliday junction resolvase